MTNEQRRNQLPAIIVEYIDKVNDQKSPHHQRDIYCLMLERIRDACDENIKRFKNKNSNRR